MSQLISKAIDTRKENNATKENVDEIMCTFPDLVNESIDLDCKEIIVFQNIMIMYSIFCETKRFRFRPTTKARKRLSETLKISGFYKSIEGANVHVTIRSVFNTAIKNNQNPLEIIRLIAQCDVATEQLQFSSQNLLKHCQEIW